MRSLPQGGAVSRRGPVPQELPPEWLRVAAATLRAACTAVMAAR